MASGLTMNAEEKVLQAERDWLNAHLAGDVAGLGRLMHADYVQIRPDGSMRDKQRVLASFEARDGIGIGPRLTISK